MTIRKAYTIAELSGRMQSILISKATVFILLSFLVLPARISAQIISDYDEIMIYLDIPRVGGTEITAVIKEQNLYLPVTELFDFLKIKNTPDPDLAYVSGFFINPEATYLISRADNEITYQKQTFKLEPGDLIRTESNLYLKSTWFGKVFGLDCVFSFRNLSVTINTQLELPMIREMRMEEMRQNLTRLKGEVKADTSIGQTRPMFQLGVADWAVIATEEINGITDATVNLGLGGDDSWRRGHS